MGGGGVKNLENVSTIFYQMCLRFEKKCLRFFTCLRFLIGYDWHRECVRFLNVYERLSEMSTIGTVECLRLAKWNVYDFLLSTIVKKCSGNKILYLWASWMNPVWHEMQPKVGDTLVSRKKPSAKKRDKKKTKKKTERKTLC